MFKNFVWFKKMWSYIGISLVLTTALFSLGFAGWKASRKGDDVATRSVRSQTVITVVVLPIYAVVTFSVNPCEGKWFTTSDMIAIVLSNFLVTCLFVVVNHVRGKDPHFLIGPVVGIAWLLGFVDQGLALCRLNCLETLEV